MQAELSVKPEAIDARLPLTAVYHSLGGSGSDFLSFRANVLFYWCLQSLAATMVHHSIRREITKYSRSQQGVKAALMKSVTSH